MLLRTVLLTTSMLASPALAAIDPPAASTADQRIRTVVYDPDNPVKIYTAPGASLRIELGADETVATIVVSDQGTLTPEPAAPTQSASLIGQQQGTAPPPSCDPNLCRSVVGNFVYLKPLRPLDQQPLFIQTSRTDAAGKQQMVAYTFELLTRPSTSTPPLPAPVWGVKFVYPDRVKAVAAAEQAQRWKEGAAAARVKAALPRITTAAPDAHANWRYGYRGAASIEPDQVWDDGRTTFIRFNGNRRVPNIYNRLPDGHESIPAVAAEPDDTGNTLRIAHTDAKWFVRDGDEAGCLFDLGPDPEGKTTTTVAAKVP